MRNEIWVNNIGIHFDNQYPDCCMNDIRSLPESRVALHRPGSHDEHASYSLDCISAYTWEETKNHGDRPVTVDLSSSAKVLWPGRYRKWNGKACRRTNPEDEWACCSVIEIGCSLSLCNYRWYHHGLRCWETWTHSSCSLRMWSCTILPSTITMASSPASTLPWSTGTWLPSSSERRGAAVGLVLKDPDRAPAIILYVLVSTHIDCCIKLLPMLHLSPSLSRSRSLYMNSIAAISNKQKHHHTSVAGL